MRISDWSSDVCSSDLVPIETMIITATRLGIGMIATSGLSTTSRNSRNTPDNSVESRVLPPDFPVITYLKTPAQPHNAPKQPGQHLTMHWPRHSPPSFDSVSVTESLLP